MYTISKDYTIFNTISLNIIEKLIYHLLTYKRDSSYYIINLLYMINDEKQLKEIVNLIVSLPAHLLNIYQLQSLPYEIFKKKKLLSILVIWYI